MVRAFLWLIGSATALELTAHENPIRRIVNLLQSTQKKVEDEGEQQEEMFEKFVCYCDTNSKNLAASVQDLTDAVPQNEASVKSKSEQKTQMEEELKVHKKDRSDANAAIAASEEQRAKDKAAFDAYSTEAKANLAAMKKAVAAIRKGMGEAFLQSSAANVLQKIVLASTKLSDFDQSEIGAFLQGKLSTENSSGEIVGILEQMAEQMETDLKEAIEAEAAGVADNVALVAAKKKEIAAATSAIEDKTARVGELAVAIVNAKNDLEDTKEALAEDTSYLAELKKTCAEQEALFGEVKKMRAQELEAIGATIKILNDDDALDLFKKALPSPSLMQQSLLQVSVKVSDKQRVRALLKEAQRESVRVGDKSSSSALAAQLMQLALTGKKAGFEKIIKMMDDMVELLGKEQKDDEKHKVYCEEEFERSEDEDAELKRKLKAVEAEMAEGTDAIAGLKDDIAALTQGIKDLDKSVAEATETRKEESAEYTTTKAQNSAAVQLLDVAKNQLNKFYNPALYKAPQRRELTEEERIYVQSGGADPRDAEEAAAAQGTIAGTGVALFTQLRVKLHGPPPPPPMAVEAYKKQDSSGPVALLDRLMNDLKMEMQEDDIEEKTAQKDYEEMMAKSAEKRATDSKTIVEKETQKAEAEALLAKAKKEHKGKTAELMALQEYVSNLHADCDFLVKNFDTRKDARANEVDAIKKAKAVLSGADYSFVQTGVREERLGFLRKNVAVQGHCPDDEKRRVALFQSLTVLMKDANDACVEMCKNTGAYPNCACPRFEPPDSTPGVVTWDELYDMFDSLKDQGREMLKKYHKISA
jgi:chromosome segregation ATPase